MSPLFLRIAALVVCLGSKSLSDDFKTINETEYKNVQVSGIEPDGIMLKTKSGLTKVYFTELPKEVQQRFHYDAQQGPSTALRHSIKLRPLINRSSNKTRSALMR